MTFAQTLTKAVTDQKLSKKKAAGIAGINYVCFVDYSNGKNCPSYNTAIDILQKLGWELEFKRKL